MSLIKQLLEQEDDGLPRGDEPGMFPEPIRDDQLVLVKGLGRYTVKQVRDQVKRMIADIAKDTTKDPVDWHRVKWKMKHSALHAFIETLANLEERK